MAKVFVTDRKNKGLEVVAGKYNFIDGIMPVSDSDAVLLEPILTRYYGATLEDVASRTVEDLDETVDSSILAAQTRAAELAGSGFSTDAAVAAGKAAGDPSVTGTVSGSDAGETADDINKQNEKSGGATATATPTKVEVADSKAAPAKTDKK